MSGPVVLGLAWQGEVWCGLRAVPVSLGNLLRSGPAWLG